MIQINDITGINNIGIITENGINNWQHQEWHPDNKWKHEARQYEETWFPEHLQYRHREQEEAFNNHINHVNNPEVAINITIGNAHLDQGDHQAQRLKVQHQDLRNYAQDLQETHHNQEHHEQEDRPSHQQTQRPRWFPHLTKTYILSWSTARCQWTSFCTSTCFESRTF